MMQAAASGEWTVKSGHEQRYRCIVVDPPWPQQMSGKYSTTRNQRPATLPYPTLTVDAIKRLPIHALAAPACHLWLWTTNSFLESAFAVLRAWDFRYLAPIHWIKPSGIGNYFVHRTQTMLFAYKPPCRFPLRRFAPNIIQIPRNPPRHSEKPAETYAFIESISPGPRADIFARRCRPDWAAWGNEIETAP